jgi:hypothetical protein
VTALVSPQAANIERVGFAVLGLAEQSAIAVGMCGKLMIGARIPNTQFSIYLHLLCDAAVVRDFRTRPVSDIAVYRAGPAF